MGMVASGEDEEGFDVSDTIFGRFELDSILAKAYQLRPILQLSDESASCTELTHAVLRIGFDVPDTISGRYELDSALVQTSKPRPILQLCIPVLLH
ncbi:hypothetical protein EV368DRAFT_78389 [Lentinula lateritia]|uniref:Uncharacterized protein n=1 Tax=Lentinula aff. lateritia TaxID=2804960 RepID=A0ACC1U0D8_9AGAR|nr:hypothetical protein F5876DRAFT_76893 [Lentinula aff. lateritia]KAJ3856729.1 hypothetical protein EV368DRAFT_78389 [Lentinula lateritia]